MFKKNLNDPSANDILIRLSTLGTIMFALGLLGLWLDQKFHTLPIFVLVGILLGVLYSFYEIWQIYKEKQGLK